MKTIIEIIKEYFEPLLIVIKFMKICVVACNPIKPDLSLTWKEAWKKAKEVKCIK